MSESKTHIKRDGTMQVTAKEGIEYLEASGEQTLLKMQGLKDARDSTEKVERQGTMISTAKEGEEILAGSGIDPAAHTRHQQKELDTLKESPPKHKLAKDSTMITTAKEGGRLLVDTNIDHDAHTRGQQRHIDVLKGEQPVEKKARLSKEGTMAVTTKEGKALLGDDQLGDTRSETRDIAESDESVAAPPKRETTMDQTVAAAKHVIVGVSTGGRTRSQAAGGGDSVPPVRRDGTMKQTIQEGEEFLGRGEQPSGGKE